MKPIFITLFIFVASMVCTAKEELLILEGKKVFLLNSDEGYEYLIQSDFVNSITNLDISLRMKEDFSQKSTSIARDAYSEFMRKQIKNWSGRHKNYLTKKFNIVYEQMSQFSYEVIPDTLYLIRSTGDQEFNAFYTVKKAIIFPGIIWTSANLFPWLPYFSRLVEHKLIHELFHIFSTYHPDVRLKVYEIFGFSPIT